jgi:hypothetical protein
MMGKVIDSLVKLIYGRGALIGHSLASQVTEFPTECTVPLNARTKIIIKIRNMEYAFDLSDPYEYRMEKALDLLNRELDPNYGAMAKRSGLGRTTLSRRFRGITVSRAEAISEIRQCLTIAQEEALIKQINKLSIRNIPPTSQIVKNLAEEICGRKVYKNWTANFVHRHKDRLKSAYLRNIDNNRAKAMFEPNIRFFFELVECSNPFQLLPLACYCF